MIETLFIGLGLGSVLLLVALGLAITYGTMGVINMAHGEMVMLGAYTAVLARTQLHLGLFAAIPFAFLLTALAGALIERIVVRRLYGRLLDTLLATWGVAILLQQAVRLEGGLSLLGYHVAGLGPGLQNVPVPHALVGTIRWCGVEVSAFRSFVILATIMLTLATWLLVHHTAFGLQLRAVTRNPDMAAACGIDVQRINILTFAYGSGLAGIAGVMLAGFKTVFPDMGTPMVVDAFLVVVVGGVGSLLGSVASALLLGQIAGIASALSSDVVARTSVFAVVMLVILIRPRGLFAPARR